MPPIASNDLGDRLDALVESADNARHLDTDPIRYVHRADLSEREFVGLIAALLAFGNVVAVRASIERLLIALDGTPRKTVKTLAARALQKRLAGFVHRVYRGEDLATLLSNAAKLDRVHGSLGAAFHSFFVNANEDLNEALALFADALRGPSPSRSLAHLVPDPRKGSACKRLILYLRWMIRPADGVDFGLWPIDPSHLVIPVDTHILRIARNLGLTDRKDASWKTATEITASLRRFNASDPVRYDFALCHFGISRACPSKRDEIKCASCAVRSVCRVWRSRAAVEPRSSIIAKPRRKLRVERA